MTQMSRRKLIGGVGAGISVLLAGCADADASSVSSSDSDEDYEYISSVESTVIGDEDKTNPGVIVQLSDFAVSKHSAASNVKVFDGDNQVGESTIVESNSLTIPTAGNSFDAVVVTDDTGNTLGEYSI